MKNLFINRISMPKKLAILVTLLLIIFLKAEAQNTGITLKHSRAALETILEDIKAQTDVNIVYNHEQVKKAPSITIALQGVSVEHAIKEVLKSTALEYQKVDGNIVIKPKKQMPASPAKEKDEKTQTIRGRVIDRDSKAGLPFANVVVMNTQPMVGVTSDEKGYFKIESLPVGRHTLQVSYLGYENAILPEVLLGSAKEVIVDIELTERLQDMDEVTVSVKKGQPLNEMATLSAKSFSVEETKRYAASISDPARMAQVFAGVATTDDASNEIVIRGNSPNWMLWRLEGVEIPSPNHFAEEGFTAGAVSILSTNMIGKSDFYTGAFPAEYGNALSGVFDLKLRNGNNEQREYSLQAGVLGVEAAAEGPFVEGYRGSYLINYRYATFSLLNNLNLEVAENALPNYQDLSFKFNFPTEKAGTFSLWTISGLSDAFETYVPDTLLGEELDDGYIDNTKTGMYASGLNHLYFINQRSYIKSVLSSSGSRSNNDVSDMDTLGIMHEVYQDEFSSNALRLYTYYNLKYSSRLTLRTGFGLSGLSFNYKSRFTDEDQLWLDGINGNGTTEIYNAFVQTKYKLSEHITLSGGMHYMHFALSNDHSLEPRAAVLFDLSHSQQIGVSFGMHSKNENLPVYYVDFDKSDAGEKYLNKSLGLTRSIHYVLSYSNLISRDWLFKSELYYQDITQLPVPNNPNKLLAPAFNGISSEDTLENKGQGRNYGLELTLQKFFTRNYYLLFSGSIFDSRYKALDNQWRHTRFNSNYIFNLVAGKEMHFGGNKMLSLNGRLLWNGGTRYIPIDLEESRRNQTTAYRVESLYSEQAPDYFRLDLGVKLYFFKEKTQHVISLDIQNTTNRFNVWYYYYNPVADEIEEYPMAGLIPILNYRIEF